MIFGRHGINKSLVVLVRKTPTWLVQNRNNSNSNPIPSYEFVLLLANTFRLLTIVLVVVSRPLLDITVVVVCWTNVERVPFLFPFPGTDDVTFPGAPPLLPFKYPEDALGGLPKDPARVVFGDAVGVDAKDPFVELVELLITFASSTTVIATCTRLLDSSTSAEQHKRFWKKE